MQSLPIGALQNQAIESLKRNWGGMTAGCAIAYGLLVIVSAAVSFLVQIVLTGVMAITLPSAAILLDQGDIAAGVTAILLALLPVYALVASVSLLTASSGEFLWAGIRRMAMRSLRGLKPKADMVFEASGQFWRLLGVRLWIWLLTFAWSLLFVVPGIVKGLSYSMAPYLAAEYPDLPIRETIRLSMRITQGRKGDLFLQRLLLFAWSLLAAVAACTVVGPLAYAILWLIPFEHMFTAAAYEWIKIPAKSRGLIDERVTGRSAV